MSLPPPSFVAPARPPTPLARPQVSRPAARRIALGATGAAVLADLVGHHGVGTVAGALALTLGPLVVLVAARPPTRPARAALVAAVPFGPWLAVRDSHWLLPLDIVAVAALVVWACATSRSAPVLDRFAVVAQRAVGAAAAAVRGPLTAWDCLHVLGVRRGRTARRVGRALLWAGPLLVTVAALLASADALVARWLGGTVDGAAVVRHAVLLGVGGLVLVSLVTVARAPLADGPERGVLSGRQFEAVVALAGLAVLLGLFVVAQVVAALAGASYVQARTGLTYAEYARAGFFQLLAVAVLTFTVVVALRSVLGAAEGRTRRVLQVLAVVVVLLTEAMVAVAIRRLALYDEAFGLTMLRLYSMVFAAWLGGVLLLAAASVVWPSRRAWLVPTVLGAALAGVLAMNAVDPESVVVRHDVARAERTGSLDVAYLVGLSDDAVPALVHAAEHGSPAVRAALAGALCDPANRHHDHGRGLAANRADRRSVAALARLCDA